MQDTETDRSPRPRHHMTIVPPSGWALPDVVELVQYRDLLLTFAYRNLSLVYRQSVLGIGWALARPLAMMVIFSIVFGRFAGMDRSVPEIPYPVFVLTGLVVWNFFATAVASASDSVVAQADVLTKIYFPRLILPISAMTVATLDFLIQLMLLVVVMFVYGVVPAATLLFVPLLWLAAVLTALAAGVWLTALNVRFRDVKHTVPFLVQILLFLTPVIYPVSRVPETWQTALHLNPMFGIVQGFRWAVLGVEPPNPWLLSGSILLTVVVLLAGLIFFRRTETTFADVI